MSRIAFVEPFVAARYPSGSCVRSAVAALADDHELTVFSTTFEDPTDGRARFVRIPALARVGLTLLPTFWAGVGAAVTWRRLRGARYDAVVTLQGYAPVGSVRYAHGHARGYAGPRTKGLRGTTQRLTGVLQRRAEWFAYRRASTVVAVSAGLAGDLAERYPRLRDRTVVLPNPVDLAAHVAPADFDREAARAALGFGPADVVLVLVALGHFEHKGLPQVLDALRALGDDHLRLVVVGGSAARVRDVEKEVADRALTGVVRAVGAVDDPRSHYWAADALVLPSRYETFSLVAHEAAAAGLPLVATPVHGVRDLLAAGAGWEVTQDAASVRAALVEVLAAGQAGRRAAGERARASVAHLDLAAFDERWRRLVVDLAAVGWDASSLPEERRRP